MRCVALRAGRSSPQAAAVRPAPIAKLNDRCHKDRQGELKSDLPTLHPVPGEHSASATAAVSFFLSYLPISCVRALACARA